VRSLLDQADDTDLMACFRAAAEAGATVPAAATGPGTTWHALSVFPECTSALRENKARLREGIARLLRAGKIRRESYTNGQRKTQERLVIASQPGAPVCAGSKPAQNLRNPLPPCASSSARGTGGLARTNTPSAEPAQPTPALGLVEVEV
jgi:hypothetical protein